MTLTTRQIAERLAQRALAVCQTYLSNGSKNGRYWVVGDAYNSPGRSLYLRLTGPAFGPGAAGKWTDAATGEHGDLLDIIRMANNYNTLTEARNEALRFLNEPTPILLPPPSQNQSNTAPAARRLFAASKPIPGTLAETYLRARAITGPLDHAALRFHPRCYYSEDKYGPKRELPALIAAVTDLSGAITAVQRTYLALDGLSKAKLITPRRALGDILGHAVRFGTPDTVLAVGEGVETILALRTLMPALPANAALSAAHLAALILPPRIQRLYIAVDNDDAGRSAANILAERYANAGIDIQRLTPLGDDWNSDTMQHAHRQVSDNLRQQLHADDSRLLTALAKADA